MNDRTSHRNESFGAISASYRVRSYFIVLISIATTLFVGTSGVVFADNLKEFSEGFFSLLLIPCVVVCCLSFLAAIVLARSPQKISQLVLVLLTAISFLLYFQSNFLVWEYGAFDGNGINWANHRRQEFIDLAVWIGTFLLAVLLARRIVKYAVSIAFIIIVLQLVNLFPRFQAIGDQWWSKTDDAKQQADFFQLSSTRNVIVVLLDMFEGPAFSYIINRDPQYAEMFRDFTFFRNTTGSFPTTFLSIPAILSGRPYDNSVPINEFLDDALIENSLPSILHREGYKTDLVTLGLYCARVRSDSCLTLAQSGTEVGTNRLMRERAKLFDIALFRAVPQSLKRYVYNDELWLLQRLFQRRKGAPFHLQSIQTVERFEHEAKVATDRPVFKFIHLMLPHTPFRYDSQCNFSKEFTQVTVRDYSVQARCALRLASRIVETLKGQGVYDKSTIVVLSDHGFVVNFGHYKRITGFPEIAKALPLLLVKHAGDKRELQTSEVPAQLIDVAHTIATDLGVSSSLPGVALQNLDADTDRVRLFRHYKWKNDNWTNTFLPPMQEYAIQGDAWKMESWKKLGDRIPPVLNANR